MKLINGHGTGSTNLMLVGDYPTEEEYNLGESLVGKVGSSIGYALSNAGSSLDEVYRTHYIKLFHPDTKKKVKKIREDALDRLLGQAPHSEILLEEIRQIKPNVIVAIGERALNFLTAEKGIDNFRGSVLPISPLLSLPRSIKVIPTLHPRRIWENYEARIYVNVDYKRAVKLQNDPMPPVQNGLLWIARTTEAVNEYWSRARKGEFLVFDIETWCNVITCIGFCADGHEAVCVPLLDNTSSIETVYIWKAVAQILASNMPKVNHNIKFDDHQCSLWGFKVNEIIDDSMLLAHSVYPEFPKKLQFHTSVQTSIPYYKDEGSDFNPKYKDKLYLYNAKDCLATHQVYTGLRRDAKEICVWDFHRNKVWPLFDIYKKIDQRGILIDKEQQAKLANRYTNLYNQQVYELFQEFGREFNVRSPQQVATFIYDYLECPKMTHQSSAGTETFSTDKESLEELYINHPMAEKAKLMLKKIILIRKINTLIGYINRTLHPDCRMRTSYKLHGTTSGRTSGTFANDSYMYFDEKQHSKLCYGKIGGSLQVIPKRKYEMEEFEGLSFGDDIPSMFVPTPGYVFIEGDGKAAEARVVFVEAMDFETLHKLDSINPDGTNYDLHRVTASWTIGKPVTDITEIERENWGKRARHAGHYDMTKWRLSTMVHKPVNLCDAVLTKFHAEAPKIRLVFHAQTRSVVEQGGYLVTPHGRRRDFFGRISNSFWKEVYSYRPQAIVSDHVKLSIAPILTEVPEAYILVEKHDSLLAEVPKDLSEKYCEVFKRVLERPISFKEGSLPRDYELVIPADISMSGENWQNMRKVKI